jgi:ComF family protein
VNITLWKTLAEMFCPHLCCVCWAPGGILCECCKKYMLVNADSVCLECGETVEGGSCEQCRLSYDGAWFVGYRDEPVGKVVEMYKQRPIRALGREIADLLGAVLPCERDVAVVPVPTARRHVRERGFDHMRLVASGLSRLRGWELADGLVFRRRETRQTGAVRRERVRQAAEAFEVRGEVDSAKTYLVVDDIWTTGATIKNICRLLREAGATKILVAVAARSR